MEQYFSMKHIFDAISVEVSFDPIVQKVITCAIVSKKEGKDQESIQSSTTPDPGYQWESANFIIRHHTREPRGQHFPSR